MSEYAVHLAPAAARAFEKLPIDVREQIARSLRRLGTATSGTKSVKTIRGAGDSFQRLRVGDYRVMFDIIETDRVILVLGIVHRRDLERWIRAR